MKNKNKSLNNWISIIVLIVFLIIGRYYVSDEKNNTITNVSNVENSGNSITENIRKSNNNQNTKNLINNVNDINSSYFGNSNENQSILGADSVDWNNDKLNIMFFYVGQADSSFIKLNDKSILIDAGNNGDGENISKFLKEKGINKIDYLIGTHCDEDHIGGLDEIIDNIDVENIMMPSHGSETVNYKNVVKSAKKKNLQVNNPNVGDELFITYRYQSSKYPCTLSISLPSLSSVIPALFNISAIEVVQIKKSSVVSFIVDISANSSLM